MAIDPNLQDSSPARELSFFQMGPDLDDNLHQQRPYFLLPLAMPRNAADPTDYEKWVLKHQHTTMGRIKAWVRRSEAAPSNIRDAKPKGKVTDLYVLSHGWHRNIFGAVSAYDRITSRIALLIHRGRLPVPAPYHPIFVNLHWHSDPGHDAWIDPAGRRNKQSFMGNVKGLFSPRPGAPPPLNNLSGEAQFENDFEDVFEEFQTISAPGVDAFEPYLFEKSKKLCATLNERYCLQEAPNAELFDMVSALWTCYYESTPRKLVLEQKEKPSAFLNFKQLFSVIWKFIVAVLGLMTVLSFLLNLSIFDNRNFFDYLGKKWDDLVQWTVNRGWLPYEGASLKLGLLVGAGLFIFSMGLLYIFAWRSRARVAKRKPTELTPGVLVFWAYATLVCAAPLLSWVLLTFIVGPIMAVVRQVLPKALWGLPREQNPTGNLNLAVPLASLARWPNRIISRSLPPGPRMAGPIDAVDAQVAFWEMQAKGCHAGAEAAGLIKELFDELPELEGARVHVLGHSFGGLVVCNIAHTIANVLPVGKWTNKPDQGCLATVCTLQGALASNWYSPSPRVVDSVSTTIAAVYSRYDTANMFYYPMANRSRKAQGYVGLCDVPGYAEAGEHPCPPSCTERHIHRTCAFVTLADPPRMICDSKKAVMNVDGSRIIYDGPAGSGGAHTDIFKDDVVHLLWGVAHRTLVCTLHTPGTPPGGTAAGGYVGAALGTVPASRDVGH